MGLGRGRRERHCWPGGKAELMSGGPGRRHSDSVTLDGRTSPREGRCLGWLVPCAWSPPSWAQKLWDQEKQALCLILTAEFDRVRYKNSAQQRDYSTRSITQNHQKISGREKHGSPIPCGIPWWTPSNMKRNI
ncbi:uncharacterized protein LOC143691959 [Agelaius phoeniceus]|uniref:uncharacterized protein LOC143691959 n=1 Tax=Agelaius phoeniceus TaxID=39638 RepID=UPI004054D15E